jgi:hypothetical protein
MKLIQYMGNKKGNFAQYEGIIIFLRGSKSDIFPEVF